MSDTDDDFMPNDIEFTNGMMGMGARSLNHPNLTNGAIRNNMIASKYNMPNKYMDYGRQGVYSRRDTSPMSLRSLPSSRMHFQNSYYQRKVNCQGSVYNKRCRSPMSVRSVGSNASAANILLDLKRSSLSINDLRMIKNACSQLLGSQSRRKIGKRRSFKSIMKFYNRKSGGESVGSDSSHSSDDCRSTRSRFYKENFPTRKTRLLQTNSDKYTTQPSVDDIYEDRTQNLKQNSLRNLLIGNNSTGEHRSMHYERQQSFTYERDTNIHQKITHMYSGRNENGQHINFSENTKDVCEKRSIINPQHTVNDKIQNESVITLKGRFKENSFLLPSQRFNKPVAHSTTYEVSFKEKSKKNLPQTSEKNNKGNTCEEKSQMNKKTEHAKTKYVSDSENYEIFSQSTGTKNTMHSNKMQLKRIIETEDMIYPERKRNKLSISPQIQNETASSKIIKLNNKDDYNFKKPQQPRMCNFLKRSQNTDSEILIAKSSQPLIGVVSEKPMNMQIGVNLEDTHNRQATNKLSQTAIDIVNDISMTETVENISTTSKPSFIKRKLFTQNLDIVESKNLSDHLNGNSPQPKTLRACREKNKVRKLVTSQSCLSHDVAGDNNVIDLIHKIVPAEKINVTSTMNKHEALKSNEDEDKWDVMSIISRSKIDDASDTYSDEEIFNAQQGNKNNTNGHKDSKEVGKLKCITKESSCTKETRESILKHTKAVSQCKVVINKLSDIQVDEPRKPKKICPVKSFWDTDLSDIDDNVDSSLKMKSQREQRPKKKGLVKSFWDTDLSEAEESFKENNKENQTRRLSLRNTMVISYNNRTRNNINCNAKGQKSTESKNSSNRIGRSQSKSKEVLVDAQIQNARNGKINAKRVIKEKTLKTKAKPSSTKEQKQEESPINLNLSRQSRRIQMKNKNNSGNLIPDKKSSDNCNRSRESVRLKQKRERSIQILKGKT